MPRKLTPKSSLESLKREAKRWLSALRSNVADARDRFERAHPGAPHVPTLRDVQHALARELGFAGWAELKTQLARGVESDDADATLVHRFLDNACPDHHVRGGGDHVRAQATAMRLLARHPQIAHASFITEVVCGDLAAVTRMLVEQPDLASRKDSPAPSERSGSGGSGDLYSKDLGSKGWEPLLYLCFTRLPLSAVTDNAVAIARELLERGADPNVYFMAGDSRYTALVGAIGEGEESRPAHPQRDALVRLLLEYGAEPYDMQVGYNMHFKGDVLWFLELIYEKAMQLGRDADWRDPEWTMLGMGNYGQGARWYLGAALENDDLALAEWCLAHGASANAAPPKATQLPHTTLYEQAVRRGQAAMAELLVRYGAVPVDVALTDVERFTAACLRMDRDQIALQLARHPKLLAEAEPLLEAARRDRVDVIQHLLDLGASPNVENAQKVRPLHAAAQQNSLNAARLLIERGADVDPVEGNWGGTPLGNASYAQYAEIIELLSRYSRDVWALVYAGKIERLKELFAEEPESARVKTNRHSTLLMWLPPGDEQRAMDVARLLVAYGADPTTRNEDGMTAADRAERMGMSDVANMLRAASAASAALAGGATVEKYDRMAANLLDAYRTGTPAAMQRHWNDTWHRRSWDAMRRYVQLDLGRHVDESAEPADISLDDARWLVARDHGFADWSALVDDVARRVGDPTTRTRTRMKVIAASDAQGRSAERFGDLQSALERASHEGDWVIDASGEMTDDLLQRISRLDRVTGLRLAGSTQLTDTGVRSLAAMPQLRELDLSNCPVGDDALAVLRVVPALEQLSLSWTRVTDTGAALLGSCERLQRIDLGGTHTGDGALAALTDKPSLRHVTTGARVTQQGIAHLQRFPAFKNWHGHEIALGLLSPQAEPNSLSLHGSFGDRGLAQLAGLDGLFALDIADGGIGLTADGIAPLVDLPHLGWLSIDATDASMPWVASMPHLRFLMCQDTAAGDDGFAALSRSKSIEFIWGRRCHDLRDRGFEALANMPALCGLSVSCLNVSDAALAALPRFPALREIMPMDVPDDGYRHIAQCSALESLQLMYCRDTGDVATQWIACLPKLTKYFASYTRATDRTPELLAEIESLERIELAACAGITDAGVARLAGLPHLRELSLSGMRHVTRASVAAFPARVHVDFSL